MRKKLIGFTILFNGILTFSIFSCKNVEGETSAPKMIPTPLCIGKKQIVKIFSKASFSNNSNHLALHYGEASKVKDKVTRLSAGPRRPKLVINAGYFSESDYSLASWHSVRESDFLPQNKLGEHKGVTARPRSCFHWKKNGDFAFGLNQEKENPLLTDRSYTSVCAGPRVIKDSNLNFKKALCDEEFSSDCRTDGVSVLSENSSLPRSGICLTNDENLKFFHVSHPILHCGLSVEEMSEWMLANDCDQGLLLDGGASAQMMALDENNNQSFYHSPWIFHRRVPIWIAVF